MTNHWVISPFDYRAPDIWQRVWQFNLKEGFISVGWRALKNVSSLSESQIYQRHRKTWPDEKERGANADSKVLYKFWHDIAIGHTVIARRGRKSIAAIGSVLSEPYYQPAKAKSIFAPESEYAGVIDIAYPNHIDIAWHDEPRDLRFVNQVFSMQALHSISSAKLRELLDTGSTSNGSMYPDDIVDDYVEGGRKSVIVNAYERSPAARATCLKLRGYRCSACEMFFVDVYGEIGINFIHVHHTNPVAARKKKYRIIPTKDLVPVCPNCHAMLHSAKPPLSVAKLRQILTENAT